MNLVAKIEGKTVQYDSSATLFVVEERRGRKFCTVASRESINSAVEKFLRVKRQRMAKLSQVVNGRVKKIVVGRAA